LSSQILQHLPHVLDAYKQLREARHHGFADSALYQIVLGAALRVNPFRKPKPGEIRRLCIEHHDRLAEIRQLFLTLAARRPTEQWTTLIATYRRAIQFFRVAKTLRDWAHKLKVTRTEQLDSEHSAPKSRS
jgi:hypothetical protein